MTRASPQMCSACLHRYRPPSVEIACAQDCMFSIVASDLSGAFAWKKLIEMP
jgi:hypothetical protein